MKAIRSEVTNEKLAEEFETVVAETEQLLKSVAGAGGDKAGALQANVAQILDAAGERLAQIREKALGEVSAAARTTDEYVHGSPWQAIGIAAGLAAVAGLVTGLLVARR